MLVLFSMCSFFDDAARNCATGGGKAVDGIIVNNELGRTWMKAVVGAFALSRHLPGRSEENHEKPQSGY
jgi:hypothetical protein